MGHRVFIFQKKYSFLSSICLILFVLSGCTVVQTHRIAKKQISSDYTTKGMTKYTPEYLDNMPNLMLPKRKLGYSGNYLENAGETITHFDSNERRYMICLKDTIRYITNNDYKYRNILSRVRQKELKVNIADTFRYVSRAKIYLYNRYSTSYQLNSYGPNSELYEYLNSLNSTNETVSLNEQSKSYSLGDTKYNTLIQNGSNSVLTGNLEVVTAYQIIYHNDSLWIINKNIDDLYLHDLYTVHKNEIVINDDGEQTAWIKVLDHIDNHTPFAVQVVLKMSDTLQVIQHFRNNYERKYPWASKGSIITERRTSNNNGKRRTTVRVSFQGDNISRKSIEITHKYLKYNIVDKDFKDLRSHYIMDSEKSSSKWY